VSPFPSVTPVFVPVGARSQPDADFGPMSGFLVVDVRGKVAGRVEQSSRSELAASPGVLAIRSGVLRVRRHLLPPESIEHIDGRSHVIGLRIDRKTLRTGRS
jgi:hypothetical protein